MSAVHDDNYTKIDLTSSYDKNLHALKRIYLHLPWWFHVAVLLLAMHFALRIYHRVRDLVRERSYKLEQRRRHGIPDSDRRSFKVALAAANESRRQRILHTQAEEKRRRQHDQDESSQWRMLGKSTGWCPNSPAQQRLDDVTTSSLLPGSFDTAGGRLNTTTYEAPRYDYIPSQFSSRISRSPSIASDLHSLRYQPSHVTEELPELSEESDAEELDMSVDHATHPNLSRKRSMDELSQIDESDLFNFEERFKRRRATSVSTNGSDARMSDVSYDDVSSRRSTTPQNVNRGRKRSFDDTSDVVSVSRRSSKMPKNSDEWTDLSGTTYKYDNGVRKRLAVVKEWRSKYNMPKDSKHPDRDVKLRVFVERWITDEEYQNLIDRYELAWQPDEDEVSAAAENSQAQDESVSQASESNQSQASRKSSSVYYTTKTPIKRQVSNVSMATPSVSSVTSSPPNSTEGKLQSAGRLRLNKKNKSDIALAKSSRQNEKEREADLLKSIRQEKASQLENEAKEREKAAQLEERKKEEAKRKAADAEKQKEEAVQKENAKEKEEAAKKEESSNAVSKGPASIATPSFSFGAPAQAPSQSSTPAPSEPKKEGNTPLPSFNFGGSSADKGKSTSFSFGGSQPPQAGGFSFNLGK
ncbi:hypothetical protein E3P99_02144 [Wallemia hederae]|uniref:Uncharacterized protein n=1 Tax=Wallemia hederae TaxID=1540922 RepID=A0A4T0FR66_9BASI|nr:hypothetical protein E3P99_02144 [Wallemia hederae]